MQHRLPFGCAVAASIVLLVSPLAGAREPVRLAQAESPQPEEESAPGAEEAAPGQGADVPLTPRPPPRAREIEDFWVHAGESDAVADVEAADSVTAFDAADLEALGAQTVEDIGKFTPNLEIVTTGSTTPTFFIRGVGLNDFNANSVSAVAVYQDDVPINSTALQLGTLFDMEGVNVLRGPQGTGPYRNASAGVIKLYSKRPTGRYSAFLRSSYGNFDYRDFEGAIEAPLWEDILSTRVAFRLTERDGYGKNRCAGAPADPPFRPSQTGQGADPRFSHCFESVGPSSTSQVPPGLPERVNDRGNWAARASFLFEPTLDMEWLAIAHIGKRDEQSRLGQAHGTNGQQILPDGSEIEGLLGSVDNGGYIAPEVSAMRARAFAAELAKCPVPCRRLDRQAALRRADTQVGEILAKQLDTEPYAGDYDRVGPTQNDTWGVALKGQMVFPNGWELTAVSGYDAYDRLFDLDLDFSPNVLFEIRQQDSGWQFAEVIGLKGDFGDPRFRWDVGGVYLNEELDVLIMNDFGQNQVFAVSEREYLQTQWSLGGYAAFEWDFWERFTLDGGFRYNWEKKTLDYRLQRNEENFVEMFRNVWEAPTGNIRLTYRFREDTHAFWKYTRGWKGGHYNATSSSLQRITIAEPETIDAFEVGLRGSWLDGRLSLGAQLFHYNYENYQVFTAQQQLGGQPEFVIINAEKAEVYGSELELTARPLPGMFLKASGSWLESEFLDFVQVQFTTALGDDGKTEIRRVEIQNSGNRLLSSPRFKVSLTAEQALPLGRFGTLTARWDGAWSDTTFYDGTAGRGVPNESGQLFLPKNTIGQRPFWLHNIRVGYRPPRGKMELAVWVRNLTDEVYKTFAADLTTFNETTIYFLGEPKTYGITLTAEF